MRSFARASSVVLLAGLVLAACTSAVAPEEAPFHAVRYGHAADIRAHRFVAAFELDGGGLLVTPVAANYRPHRRVGAVEREAWATDGLDGEPAPVALGSVTITRRAAGVRVVRHLVAWVALAYDPGVYHCPAFTRPGRHGPTPPSAGWTAVILGDAPRSPAVLYQAATIACERFVHARVSSASEVLSVPWRRAGGIVVASAPSCGAFFMSEFGSTPRTTSFEHAVTVPEWGDRSVGPVADPSGCAAAQPLSLAGDPEAAGVTATTRHLPVGPLRQASSTAFHGAVGPAPPRRD